VNRFLVFAFAAVPLWGSNPELLSKPWSAQWIAAAGAPAFDFGVYHFRRSIEIEGRPASFVVHVSGDNRYQLFVNGERVSLGPARGDLYHWRYETVDIAPQLKPGRNTLAAVVWNFSDEAALAQITYRTGFLLQGDTTAERVADTGKAWKCVRDEAYRIETPRVPGYYAAGPAERFDAARYPWGWEQPGFDDSRWPAAVELGKAGARDSSDSHSRWMLEPRVIPQMELKPERLARVRAVEGVAAPGGFPAQARAFEIPANTKAAMLLDQSYLTTAYPELVVSGGKGATIRIGYAEALYRRGSTSEKGHRDEVEGKDFLGVFDVYVADGAAHRMYRPLWWRTYRYVRLEIQTASEPLTLEDFRGEYTGYPFVRKARFDAGDAELEKILDVGWRTARLCAHETYMDCPYWEQLQYAGDTRVQGLVSLYTSGDGRLMRNAIALLDDSRTAEGATLSRAPSRLAQYIPGFSLWWIGMLHDYWMYQDDPQFVKERLPGVRAVLAYFAAHQGGNGSLAGMPWWNYLDWVTKWPGGVPPRGNEGGSASYDLQLLLAYQWAAELEENLGLKAMAAEYRGRAAQVASAARSAYWDSRRGLFADTAEKTEFSQHANALAALGGVIAGGEARDVMGRVAADNSLVQCSIYFRHYLHSAMNEAGLGDRYLEMLGPWRAQLALGLTTWAETADPSRSDCHAWGASPNLELFRTVLGIDSGAPGFRRVIIRPSMGKLERVSGRIPHPKGEIAVSLVKRDGGIETEVTLPAGVEGEFVWKGERRKLGSGAQRVKLRADAGAE